MSEGRDHHAMCSDRGLLPAAAAAVGQGKSGAGSMLLVGCHHSRNRQYSQSTAAHEWQGGQAVMMSHWGGTLLMPPPNSAA